MADKRLEFSDFYAAARDDCLQIVLVTVGDRQLAEDLVAECLLVAPSAAEIALGDSEVTAPGGDDSGLDGAAPARTAPCRSSPVRSGGISSGSGTRRFCWLTRN